MSVDEFLQNVDWIRRLARTLVLDENQADDISQQALLIALQSPPPESRHIRGWLRRVVRQLHFNRRREEGRCRTREAEAARRQTSLPEDIQERLELKRAVVAAVLELPEPYQTTILLRYFEELDASEIARHMGTTENTVRSRILRARRMLRDRLDRTYYGDRRWQAGLAAIAFPNPKTSPLAPSLALAGGVVMSAKNVTISVAVALIVVA